MTSVVAALAVVVLASPLQPGGSLREPPSDDAASAVERGDAAWARRAEGRVDGAPAPEPIGAAIAAYEDARAAEPDRLDVHWKLLRAMWFSSEFRGEDAVATRALLDRTRIVSDAALALASGNPVETGSDVARAYFWSAITLGAWSRRAGLLAAVGAGVAGRLHDYTQRAVTIDAAIDDGGPLRLLSRLHAEVPRVPLVSGWVDRTQSLPLAERAYALSPMHPGNQYVLGMALIETGGARRDEGLALVERTATLEPRRAQLVEDLAVRRDAAARLARERAR